MTQQPSNPNLALTEAEFRKVLQRGIAFDERRDTFISESEVRQIAEQLGISRTSIDHALLQIYTERDPTVRSNTQFGSGLPLIAGLLGGLVGVTLRITGSDFLYIGVDKPEPYLAVLAAQVIAIVIAMSMEGPARHRKYQISNLALWLGFFGGWVVMDGDVHNKLPAFTAYFTVTAGVFGSVAIHARDSIRSFLRSISAKPPTEPKGSERRPLRLRIMEALQTELWRFRIRSEESAASHVYPARVRSV
jgi:hypothetical protein